MPTYNKPGVYVEETLSAAPAVATGGAPSVAAFIGVADRGPTVTDNSGAVLAAPTLVTSWSDFVNSFSFGNVINTFSSVVEPNSDALKFAVKSFFENGGSQAYVGRLINTNASSASVTINSTAATPALTVSAKNPGVWGNKLWVTTVLNSNNSYFDLYVYYNESASSSSNISYSNHVEHFVELTMNPTSPRYALNAVSSLYISLSHPTANSANANPAALSTSGTVQDSNKVQMSGGTNGSATPNIYSQVMSTLDSIDGPLVVNWPELALPSATLLVSNKALASNVATLTVGSHNLVPGDAIQVAGIGAPFDTTGTATVTVTATASTTISFACTGTNVTSTSTSGTVVTSYVVARQAVAANQLQYAYDRGDVFVVLDAKDGAVAAALTAAENYSSSNASSAGYGAAYFPHIYVPDPSSRVGSSVKIAPGGAVVAMYMNADSQKGAFQSPAGIGTRLKNVVSVTSLTNTEFTAVSQANPQVNIIRYVPGSGICVMGARTLSTSFGDRYVAVRRSLQYINKSLVNATQYAVFEPNDQILWARVKTTVETFLYNYWRKGGLKGANAAEAYYVKCDGIINDQAAIDAGELRIEVGVALQKPAEFVIIKIGQIDGGATVTTSV